MPKEYPAEFKTKIIKRYQKGESIQSLSQELHIAQSTLYDWRREYCSIKTANRTYTPKEFDTLSRRLEKLEHELEIIRLTGYISNVPLQKKLVFLESLYQKSDNPYSVYELCEALDVARGTFYNHIFRRADRSKRDQEQARLMRLVQQVFDDSAQRFGAEKIRIALTESGIRVSTKRIAAIMQELDLHSIAVILTAVQTGAILLSGIGLPLGNEWNLAAGATEAELFSTLEQLFASPLQAFVCFTLYQLIGSWLIFGICMWIGHFTGRKWTIRIVIVLYVLSAVWIKLPAIQNIPLTSFNHLLILHHNFGEPARPWSTGFTLLLFMLTIMFSVRFAWRGHLPQLRLKCHGIAAYYSYELMTKRNILILLAVVVGITLYKGLGYGAAESDAEWIYSLFAGHGTGYFQVFPFLEMLITSGVPLYLLAAFVEHTVNGQSIFISVRAKSRRHLVKGILSVSTKFLIIYAFFWLMAGLIGASLFSTGLTIVSFRLMLYAVLMKCLDILVQYLIVLGIYIATRQVTIGFLVLVAGNLLCILPGNWVAYSPFGLSSLTRISVVEPGIGISAVSAFGIEAAILTLMIAGILMWGYKKILN